MTAFMVTLTTTYVKKALLKFPLFPGPSEENHMGPLSHLPHPCNGSERVKNNHAILLHGGPF
jgi:hypothetical protein